MTGSLPAPLSRALALAILVALFLLPYFAIVQPLLAEYASSQQAIADLRLQLERFGHLAQQRAPRQAELAALRQRQSAQDGFLQGPNDTLVAAQLQNRIKALVEASGGELKSTQTLPAQPEGKLKRVTVRAQMAIGIAGASHVFYELEAAYPLLEIDNVEMLPMPQMQRRGVSDPAGEGTINVRFDVYGFMRTGP